MAKGSEFKSQQGQEFSSHLPDWLGPTQPLVHWVLGVFSPGLKLLGSEFDHSPIISAEVKEMWIYTTAPHTPASSGSKNKPSKIRCESGRKQRCSASCVLNQKFGAKI
jgi:hypothetical protein